MTPPFTHAPPSRLRVATFAPIGEEGRTELVEARLVQAITVGAFLEGERLPSETELASLLGVAVVTVREALALLRYRGLVETRRGRNGGSFVRPSYGSIELVNAEALIALPRVALSDLGVHYETVCASCAEYACQRAMPRELDVVERIVLASAAMPAFAWRRRLTEVQLELAALSQSVRLTNEHVKLQTELTPYLALQDFDPNARDTTRDHMLTQISAIRDGDVARARAAVRASVRGSIRWLVQFRNELVQASQAGTLAEFLESRRVAGDALEAEKR